MASEPRSSDDGLGELPYAKPDVDAALRDDATGLLIRESADNPISWVAHALFGLCFLAIPVRVAWKGLEDQPNAGIVERIWCGIFATACGVVGLFALARPLNWREVYFDIEGGRVDVRWRRWGRRGGQSYDLKAFGRVVLLNEGGARSVELRRRHGAHAEVPPTLTVVRFRSPEEQERLATLIAQRAGLTLDHEWRPSTS